MRSVQRSARRPPAARLLLALLGRASIGPRGVLSALRPDGRAHERPFGKRSGTVRALREERVADRPGRGGGRLRLAGPVDPSPGEARSATGDSGRARAARAREAPSVRVRRRLPGRDRRPVPSAGEHSPWIRPRIRAGAGGGPRTRTSRPTDPRASVAPVGQRESSRRERPKEAPRWIDRAASGSRTRARADRRRCHDHRCHGGSVCARSATCRRHRRRRRCVGSCGEASGPNGLASRSASPYSCRWDAGVDTVIVILSVVLRVGSLARSRPKTA
jgi:hypothetical protein